MLDILRNWTKSEAARRQEQLNAYLDDALPPRQRVDFEQALAGDADLRQELARLQAVRDGLRRLPRRRVPRNFTLDPAVYGRPQRAPLVQAYPVLRVATAMTAFFFVLAVALQLVAGGGLAAPLAPAADVAQVEVTRVVSESAAAESEMAGETAAVEAPAAEPELAVAEEEAAPAAEAADAAAPPAEPMAAAQAVEETVEQVQPSRAGDEAGAAEDAGATDAAAAETEADMAAPVVTPELAATVSLMQPEGGAAVDGGSTIPTRTPLPTPTVSELPRPTAEPTLVAERAAPAPDGTATPAPLVAAPAGRAGVVPWLPVALGGLLLVLAGLTLTARRRMR